MQQNKVGEPKLFKLFGHFSVAFLLGATSISAQTFADFKKSQSTSFQQYKDERDNAFNSYLKQQWKAYNVRKGKPRYEEPKPTVIPPTKQTRIKSVGPKVTIKIKPTKQIISKKIEKTISKPVGIFTPVEITRPQVIQKKKEMSINFYGSHLEFDMPKRIKDANFYPNNQKGIANFFGVAASSDYEDLIVDIKKISKELNLNDWGVYLLVLDISDKIFSGTDNAKLMSWFIFNKLGYAVKIGLAHKHIVLMHYSKKTIYSTPNYSFGKKKFYVVSHYAKGNVGRLLSYKQDYPGSTKPLDLSLKTLPFFQADIKTKKLSFKEYGKEYTVPVEYNQNIIDFMSTYPQADYATFFNAPVDERTYKSIAKELKKYIDGKKAGDAMNFILHFVQKSFQYSKDDAQFNREKVMFAQETLYFDKSDCEDRAVLFAYLIKELFGISVVGVHYKGHMATALYVPMRGDYIRTKTRKLVVADPTYINANIGQSMPRYKSQKPQNLIIVK